MASPFDGDEKNNLSENLLDKSVEKKDGGGDDDNWKLIQVDALLITLSLFLDSSGYSIILPTIWSRLQTMGGSKVFLGLSMAAFPLAQSLASPVFGYIGQRGWLGPATLIGFSLLVGCGGNIMYLFANDKYVLLISRLVCGIGAANITICRSHAVTLTSGPGFEKYREKVSFLSFVFQKVIHAILLMYYL